MTDKNGSTLDPIPDMYGNAPIGYRNPFRYRGYIYDTDTGLYYLQSRYYDPKTGRFINADAVEYLEPETVNGLNLYAYCLNNPVMYSDPNGHFVITFTTILMAGLIAGAIGAGIGLGSAVYQDVKEDGKWFNGDLTDYLGKTAGGFIAGFGLGVCTALGAGVGFSILTGTTATLLTSTGVALSLPTALEIGSTVAFATGAAGYAVRAGIRKTEAFRVENMFIEGAFNASSGFVSVLGGFLGGLAGFHNTVATNLLSQKGDLLFRMLIENVFTAGTKIINSFIKPIMS